MRLSCYEYNCMCLFGVHSYSDAYGECIKGAFNDSQSDFPSPLPKQLLLLFHKSCIHNCENGSYSKKYISLKTLIDNIS